jgi:hypothetical protein
MPYRDELEAIREREAALTRELDETRRTREAIEKRSLPLLEGMHVASPCPENWDDMIGDGRARFCGRCAKEVYDLSSMSGAEAERFLREQSGPTCVTFRRRKDGKIMTSDCEVGVRRRRFGIGVVALAVIGAAGAFALDLDRHESGAERTPQISIHRKPTHAKPQEPRTMGCACLPGDPLCSCL